MCLPLAVVPSSLLSMSWSTFSSPLSSRRRTNARGSDLESDPWRWVLGLLLLGEVLLLGVLLGGPLWLVEVALISSSKIGYVSFGVFNKVLTLTCMHIPTPIAKRAWGRAAAEFEIPKTAHRGSVCIWLGLLAFIACHLVHGFPFTGWCLGLGRGC